MILELILINSLIIADITKINKGLFCIKKVCVHRKEKLDVYIYRIYVFPLFNTSSNYFRSEFLSLSVKENQDSLLQF